MILSVLNESTVFFDLDSSFSANASHCETLVGLTYEWCAAVVDCRRVPKIDKVRNAEALKIDLVWGWRCDMADRMDDIVFVLSYADLMVGV